MSFQLTEKKIPKTISISKSFDLYLQFMKKNHDVASSKFIEESLVLGMQILYPESLETYFKYLKDEGLTSYAEEFNLLTTNTVSKLNAGAP